MSKYGSMSANDSKTRRGSIQDDVNIIMFTLQKVSKNMRIINENATTLDKYSKSLVHSATPTLSKEIIQIETDTNFYVKTSIDLLKILPKKNQDVCLRVQIKKTFLDFKNTIQRYNDLQKEVSRIIKDSNSVPKDMTTSSPPQLTTWQDELQETEDSINRDLENVKHRAESGEGSQQGDIDSSLTSKGQSPSRVQQEMNYDNISQIQDEIIDIGNITRELNDLVNDHSDNHSNNHSNNHSIVNVEDTVDGICPDDVTFRNTPQPTSQTHLLDTVKYQNRARKKICYLVIILLIVIGIGITILVLYKKYE